MRINFALAGFLLSVTALASEGGSEKSWAYAELIHALDGGGIAYLEKLETPSTKCGFGPGEEGAGCVRRTLESNQACKKELVFALKQGCAMVGSSQCISPPQAADAKILYAGPKIQLTFAEGGKSMAIASLVCGGD
ncbi:hypothetical protein HMEPL2_18430 [Vreelandella aquamarina]|uniref:Uncharacterized protein n=1 Tax=Vreelandella aquamarina TaxID=77097 RepID=A0A6F8XBB5_9GAMM|nr:hypothetical protein [Halomonas meridiana]BCB71492.1 hypothetical protein HMEPL2_18430 [Halomonas meridiana]